MGKLTAEIKIIHTQTRTDVFKLHIWGPWGFQEIFPGVYKL